MGRIEKLYLLDCDITSYGVRAIAENLKQRPGKVSVYYSQFHVRPVARKSSVGRLCVCAWGLTFKKLTKTPLKYSVSYFNLWGLGAVFVGLSPPKLSVAMGLHHVIHLCKVS